MSHSSSSSSSSSTGDAREFEASIYVDASADAVFDFVAEIKNMPKYLPTTKKAESQGAGRVRVQGGGDDFSYDADGYLRRNDENNRLEWGADEATYNGWMEVDAENQGSKVTIHLTFKNGGDYENFPSQGINQGLQDALQSSKNEVEGIGGKVESA